MPTTFFSWVAMTAVNVMVAHDARGDGDIVVLGDGVDLLAHDGRDGRGGD